MVAVEFPVPKFCWPCWLISKFLGFFSFIGWSTVSCDCVSDWVTGARSIGLSTTLDWAHAIGDLVVDGNTGDTAGTYPSPDAQAVAGKVMYQFDFGSGAKIKITEARAYLQASGDGSSVWKWQASDDGSSWADIGGNFTFDQTQTLLAMTTLSANTKGYRYYRLLGVSGNIRWFYINEFEFKQCAC